MRAILADKERGPDALVLGDAPEPVPGPGELLIRVEAAGVNRADLLQAAGCYPPPPGASPVLGLELSGEVVAHGAGSRFHLGDPVMAVVTGGAYAELAVVPEGVALPLPVCMDLVEGAAIPEAFLTAWLNLVDLGELQPGETVLIHAGASGVGAAAIQMAKELGAEVIATAGSEEKLAFCRDLGADSVIHRKREDFGTAVPAATGGNGVDLILDFVGAPYWDRNLQLLRRGGRLALIGFLGGARGELNLGPVLRKSLKVRGTTLRGTALQEKSRLAAAFWAFAAGRLADGRLRPTIDRIFPLEEVVRAHAHMAADKNLGKILLRVR